jgi:hypothetical protein
MQPRDPELFRLMCAAVAEGLERLRQLPKNQFIGSHYGWGSIGRFDNGLPHFSRSYSGGPPDYSQAFGEGVESTPYSGSSRKYPFQVRDLQAFEAFIDYALAQQRFFEFFTKDNPSGEESPWSPRFYAVRDLADVIDRYVHTQGMEQFDAELLLPLYVEWEAGIFETDHPVAVLVPLLLTKFEFDSARLVDGVTIERMTDDTQVSRMMMLEHRYEAHPVVASAASHALVLHDYRIQLESEVRSWQIGSDSASFPLKVIDLVFAAIRAVSGFDTGYAQLLLRPIGWARRWTANLPALHGCTSRRYPSRFDGGAWLEAAPTIDVNTMGAIGQLVGKLLPTWDEPLGAACRRLNDCFLRDRGDDALVDALIAIETLLSDDEPWELAHKLSLRAAALSKLHDRNCDPVVAMRKMKRVYAYRSKIVHGKEKDATRIHHQFVEENTTPLRAATDALRTLIQVLADHPEFVGGTQIDHQLLLGKARDAGAGSPQ